MPCVDRQPLPGAQVTFFLDRKWGPEFGNMQDISKAFWLLRTKEKEFRQEPLVPRLKYLSAENSRPSLSACEARRCYQILGSKSLAECAICKTGRSASIMQPSRNAESRGVGLVLANMQVDHLCVWRNPSAYTISCCAVRSRSCAILSADLCLAVALNTYVCHFGLLFVKVQ